MPAKQVDKAPKKLGHLREKDAERLTAMALMCWHWCRRDVVGEAFRMGRSKGFTDKKCLEMAALILDGIGVFARDTAAAQRQIADHMPD